MAEKNIFPSFEARATDRNQVFTPRQWLERFRQFFKREHKIDIGPLLKGEEITTTKWTGKKTSNSRLLMGSGTGSTLPNN